MEIKVSALGLSISPFNGAPEIFTPKEREQRLFELDGRSVCIEFQKDIDGPQTAARLIMESLGPYGVVFDRHMGDADCYLWIQGASRDTLFAFVIVDPRNTEHYLCYQCVAQALTGCIMTAICEFFRGSTHGNTDSESEDEIARLLSSLDSDSPGVAEQAENALIGLGESGIGGILLSVDQCNRRITASVIGRDVTGMAQWINALGRRIRVLGKIGSLSGVDAILDALGDSVAGSQGPSLPVLKDLSATACDALVCIGQPAIPSIDALVNDVNPEMRRTLRQVSRRIKGGRRWWALLGR